MMLPRGHLINPLPAQHSFPISRPARGALGARDPSRKTDQMQTVRFERFPQ